jgi:hypothetical protein
LTLLQKDVRCIFTYCANNLIPKNADENLMPTRKNKKECLSAATIFQHVGKVIAYLMHRFNAHCMTVFAGFGKNGNAVWFQYQPKQFLNRWTMNYQNKWKDNHNLEWG